MKRNSKIIGAGIGLAAVAAASAYFLYGERGARNRERISGWALKMKGEVLEKLEELKTMDRDTYNKLVDEVAARYAKLEKVSASELRRLTVELKNSWSQFSKKLK